MERKQNNIKQLTRSIRRLVHNVESPTIVFVAPTLNSPLVGDTILYLPSNEVCAIFICLFNFDRSRSVGLL